MDENPQRILPGQVFQIFKKGQGRSSPFSPANCAPDASSDIRMHPKTIINTSHQNFREFIVSTLITCNKDNITISHPSTFKSITKIL